MGLFSADPKKHREVLAQAAALIAHYRTGESKSFDLRSVPLEFRSNVYLRLKNLSDHVEDTSSADLGDMATFKDLFEDLYFCQRLVHGQCDETTRRNFRTLVFDEAVDHLAKLLTEKPSPFLSESLESAIRVVEEALTWYQHPPAPASRRYSPAHVVPLLDHARSRLAALSEKPAASDRRVCARCSTANEPTARFCKQCASPLTNCRSCGRQNEADAKFCVGCAKPL